MKEDLAGKKFDRLTVLGLAPKKSGYIMWYCRCACGKNYQARNCDLLRPKSSKPRQCTSCAQGAARKIHGGKSKNSSAGNRRNYKTWADMLVFARKRGIHVSETWIGKNGYARFRKDMGSRPKVGEDQDTRLSRRDTKLGFTPENCCWRIVKRFFFKEGLNGEKCSLGSIAFAEEINRETLRYRIDSMEMSLEDALSIPITQRKKFAAFGCEKTKVDWVRDPRCRVSSACFYSRTRKGWDVEKSLTIPIGRTYSRQWWMTPFTPEERQKALTPYVTDDILKLA